MSETGAVCFQENEAAALFDGAAYDGMLALLCRARRNIRLSFFLFGGPDAEAMIAVLTERQARGVDVRVLLDRSVGLEGLLPGIVRECRRAFRRLRALGPGPRHRTRVSASLPTAA